MTELPEHLKDAFGPKTATRPSTSNDDDPHYVGRSWLIGPRWAGFSTAIKNIAWMNGLELTTEVEKSLLSETVRFRVEGPKPRVEEFGRQVQAMVDDWNSSKRENTVGRQVD